MHPFLQFIRKRGWLPYEGDAPYAYSATVHGRSPYSDRSWPGVPPGSAEASKAVHESSPDTQPASYTGPRESCWDGGLRTDSVRGYHAFDGLELAKTQSQAWV